LDCDWSYDEYLSGLRDDIEEYGSQKRTEALFRVSKAIEKKITKEIEEPIKMLIVNATPTLWQDVAQVQKDVLKTTLTIINDKLTSTRN
jgi:hypothetical protein